MIQAESPFHLIIPAAGSASRMGLDTPKPYLKINGKPLLRHTLEKFINLKNLKSITIAINKEHHDLFDEAVLDLSKIKKVIGSNTRKSSVYKCLKAISNVEKNDIILIHDAARPLTNQQDINKLLIAMEDNNAATLATPVTDTLYNFNQPNSPIDRDKLWAIQTPQAFRYDQILQAHEQFEDDDSFTDDSGLIRAIGEKVSLVKASRNNIKVTTQEDLAIVSSMIIQQQETRTALGFDVHAFELESNDRPLMLGGLKIDHKVALKGHSDADVVLHAITDAILGALNYGDIGTHFPPTDDKWKDADRALFLKEAAQMVTNALGSIKFIDVTIMAEAPKIEPHRTNMQKRIAEILSLPISRISIKATTTEKLGFTGREEGIACQAIANISLPASE